MTPRAGRSAEGGFVIIGVVIFVIALAILGVSLFSLSTIEAEFFGRSQNESQAFYSAQGGVEWARAVLIGEERLENVALTVRDSLGIVAAEASQRQNGVVVNTGPVQWNSPDSVRIRVTATVGGQTRTVAGFFRPTRGDEYYKRIITTTGGVQVLTSAVGAGGTRQNTLVIGDTRYPTRRLGYWQNSSNHAWVSDLGGPPYPQPETQHAAAIPEPSTEAYLTRWEVVADTSIRYIRGLGEYDLSSPSVNEVRHYRTHRPVATFPDNHYSAWFDEDPANPNDNEVRVRVRGLAVWMFPKGVRFDIPLVVERTGNSPGCLVIVANRNGSHLEGPLDYRDVGIWAFGGIEVDPRISLVLVSNGTVVVEQNTNNTASLTIPELSIFARDVRISGPVTGQFSRFDHPVGGALDGYINTLTNLEALPNAVPGGSHALVLRPGSWQDD